MFSYRKEYALQGALVLAKVEDRNWETIFTDVIDVSSTTMT